MASFERLRDCFPLLYRPDDDDAAGEAVPMAAGDVLQINGRNIPQGAPYDGGALIVTAEKPLVVRRVRLAPGRAPGSGYTLSFTHFDGTRLASMPATFGAVQDGLASLAIDFRSTHFAVHLRRGGLLTLLLRGLGVILDEISAEATDVLQAHWFEYADRAQFSPFFLRRRELGDPFHFPPGPRDPEAEEFPYIHDLARLAALLPVMPWQHAPGQGEWVEEYRTRISRMVELYRGGLGTVDALRRIVTAELPRVRKASAERQDRPFAIEEFVPRAWRGAAVTQSGVAGKLFGLKDAGPLASPVGPLMLWSLENDGVGPVLPTVYVEGVEAVEGKTEPTVNPVIELYAEEESGGFFHKTLSRPRLGLAYNGQVPPGKALRLRPAYLSWLGSGAGLLQSKLSEPAGTAPVDPTAAGPWEKAPKGPKGQVTAILQVHDKTLCVATLLDDKGALWRYDGKKWNAFLKTLPSVFCLAEDGTDLLIGTRTGLRRVPLDRRPSPVPVTLPQPVAGTPVFTLFRARDGTWWVGTGGGAARLGAEDALQPCDPTGTQVHAIAEDALGSLFFGTNRGLFRRGPDGEHWHWYGGAAGAAQWTPWEAPEDGGDRPLPPEERIALPAIRALYHGRDSALWLGASEGLARWVAHPVDHLAYVTRLEAFPDLVQGPVYAIQEDERGGLWFATGRGLFRFDGRDVWQFQGARDLAGTWVCLGRADQFYPAGLPPEDRGAWRFVRGTGAWERVEGRAFDGALRSTAEQPVTAICWTDSVAADLGQYDPAARTFSIDAAALPGELSMRYKPDPSTILDGGLPAVPRLPVGRSFWRYLRHETPDEKLPEDSRACTCEGRLPSALAELDPILPGRYGDRAGKAASAGLDRSFFAFLPSAQVYFAWQPREPLSVLVRLHRLQPDEQLDPAVIDRIWEGIGRVRPAGVRVALAVEEDVVKS